MVARCFDSMRDSHVNRTSTPSVLEFLFPPLVSLSARKKITSLRETILQDRKIDEEFHDG